MIVKMKQNIIVKRKIFKINEELTENDGKSQQQRYYKFLKEVCNGLIKKEE